MLSKEIIKLISCYIKLLTCLTCRQFRLRYFRKVIPKHNLNFEALANSKSLKVIVVSFMDSYDESSVNWLRLAIIIFSLMKPQKKFFLARVVGLTLKKHKKKRKVKVLNILKMKQSVKKLKNFTPKQVAYKRNWNTRWSCSKQTLTERLDIAD